MSAVKPLTIFEPIPSEVQEIIVSHCDVDTLLILNGVNKSGSEHFTNEGFFKNYFITQHPRLEPYDRLFTVLRSTHPSKCWKVMCQVMHLPKNPDINPRIATRITPSFTQEAVEKTRSQIDACEQIDKSICGSGYQDPNSPIDQRWKEFKKYEQEHQTAANEYQFEIRKLQEAIRLEFGGKQVGAFVNSSRILNQFDNHTEKFLSSSYEEFVEKAPENNAAISRDQFFYCQKLSEASFFTKPLLEEIERTRTQKLESREKYKALETQRKANEDKKQQLIQDLANPSEAHIMALSAEWHHALKLETKLTDTASLEACQALLDDLIKNPENRTPAAHQKILGFINNCQPSLLTSIWGRLYSQYANQVIQDCWAEKHCMDHLPTLKELIQDELRDLEAYISSTCPPINSDREWVFTVSNPFS